jgi:hypothetical protein
MWQINYYVSNFLASLRFYNRLIFLTVGSKGVFEHRAQDGLSTQAPEHSQYILFQFSALHHCPSVRQLHTGTQPYADSVTQIAFNASWIRKGSKLAVQESAYLSIKLIYVKFVRMSQRLFPRASVCVDPLTNKCTPANETWILDVVKIICCRSLHYRLQIVFGGCWNNSYREKKRFMR